MSDSELFCYNCHDVITDQTDCWVDDSVPEEPLAYCNDCHQRHGFSGLVRATTLL